MNSPANSPTKFPPDVNVRNGFKPGDVGYLTYLHGTLYAKEYGWDHTFDPYVAIPLSEFAKRRNERERIWIVERDEKPAGSVAIVESSRTRAQLRWLLLHPDLRGHGIGKLLLNEALGFCREQGYSLVCLWTVKGLDAATHLYASAGFQLREEKTHELWGALLTEQLYTLNLK